MSEQSPRPLDEKTLLTVLRERGWASNDDIEAAQIDIDMGMANGPLERRLHEKNVISDEQLKVLVDICAFASFDCWL